MMADLRNGVGPRRVHSCKPFSVHDWAFDGDKGHDWLRVFYASVQKGAIHWPQYGEQSFPVVSTKRNQTKENGKKEEEQF